MRSISDLTNIESLPFFMVYTDSGMIVTRASLSITVPVPTNAEIEVLNVSTEEAAGVINLEDSGFGMSRTAQ